MRLRSVFAAVCTAALLIGPIASEAAAHRVGIPTALTADFEDEESPLLGIVVPGLLEDPLDYFEGRLASRARACVVGRVVHVYRLTDGGTQLIASARVNANGTWVAQAEDPPAGTYRAVALRKVSRSRGHIHVCELGRSNGLTVSGGSSSPLPGVPTLPTDPGALPIP